MLVKNPINKKKYFPLIEIFYIEKNILIKFIQKSLNLNFLINILILKKNLTLLNYILYNSLMNFNFCLLELFLVNFFKKQTLLYNFIFFFKELNITMYIPLVNVQNKTSSLSFNFLNASWLEREVMEFSSTYFENLEDTRRLLLDYTVKKQNVGEILLFSNYNETFFEIIY